MPAFVLCSSSIIVELDMIKFPPVFTPLVKAGPPQGDDRDWPQARTSDPASIDNSSRRESDSLALYANGRRTSNATLRKWLNTARMVPLRQRLLAYKMAEVPTIKKTAMPFQNGIKLADLPPELMDVVSTVFIDRMVKQFDADDWRYSGMVRSHFANSEDSGTFVLTPLSAMDIDPVELKHHKIRFQRNLSTNNRFAKKSGNEYSVNPDYEGPLGFLLPYMEPEIGPIRTVGKHLALSVTNEETDCPDNRSSTASPFHRLASLIIEAEGDIFNSPNPNRMPPYVGFPSDLVDQSHLAGRFLLGVIGRRRKEISAPRLPGVYRVFVHVDAHGVVTLNGKRFSSIEELAKRILSDRNFDRTLLILVIGCQAGAGVYPPAQKLSDLTGARVIAVDEKIAYLRHDHGDNPIQELLGLAYPNGGRAYLFSPGMKMKSCDC